MLSVPVSWRGRRLPHWAWAAVTTLVLLAAAVVWRAQMAAAAERAAARLAEVSGTAAEVPVAAVAEPAVDFAQRLPMVAPVDDIARDAQRFAAGAGAAFVSFDAVTRPGTERLLGRVELALVLRGSYPNVKLALAQLIDRYPPLVMQRLNMRRQATGAEIDATVNLIFMTRPAPLN